MKKVAFALLLLVAYSQAQSNTSDIDKAVLMTVSDAYSQCAAYYDMMNSVLSKSNQADLASNAVSMKSKSELMATAVAEQIFSPTLSNPQLLKAKVESFTDGNYKAAINKLMKMTSTGSNGVAEVSKQYQSGCHTAIYEPGKFSDSVAQSFQSSKQPAIPGGATIKN